MGTPLLPVTVSVDTSILKKSLAEFVPVEPHTGYTLRGWRFDGSEPPGPVLI